MSSYLLPIFYSREIQIMIIGIELYLHFSSLGICPVLCKQFSFLINKIINIKINSLYFSINISNKPSSSQIASVQHSTILSQRQEIIGKSKASYVTIQIKKMGLMLIVLKFKTKTKTKILKSHIKQAGRG